MTGARRNEAGARKATLLDATAVECVLHPDRPLDARVLAKLSSVLPAGIRSAVPRLPDGAFGADVLAPLAHAAPVVEPLTWSARAELVRSRSPVPGAIVVDPEGVPLGAPLRNAPPAPGWVREAVVWARADDDATTLTEGCGAALAALAPGVRLRLRDPYGIVVPETAAALAKLPGADRLTLHIEDTNGLAVAVARAAQQGPEGFWARTSLLGIGPRSGLAPTELLVDPSDREALAAPVAAAAFVSGRAVRPSHPLYGAQRTAAAEPELATHPEAGWRPRPAPLTLPLLVDGFLHEWGARLEAAERDRVLAHLAARLRPGEAMDGPALYAVLATLVDLERLVGRAAGGTRAANGDSA